MKLGGAAIGAGATAAALLLSSLLSKSGASQSSSSGGGGSAMPVDDGMPPAPDTRDPIAAVQQQALAAPAARPAQRQLPNSDRFSTPLANGGDSSKSDVNPATAPIADHSWLNDLLLAAAGASPFTENKYTGTLVPNEDNPLMDPLNGAPLARNAEGTLMGGAPALEASGAAQAALPAPQKALPSPVGPQDDRIGPHDDRIGPQDDSIGPKETMRSFNVGGKQYYADANGNVFDGTMSALGKAETVFKGKQLLQLKNAGILARAVK